MNSLFSRHIATVGVLLILFMGVTVVCVNAQDLKSKVPTSHEPEPKSKLTAEEGLQQAHLRTFDNFKELKAAHAAKVKADCEGTPEEKKKADTNYIEARSIFDGSVHLEAEQSDAARKAITEVVNMIKNEEAAKENPSIPDTYKKIAKEQKENAYKKYHEVLEKERARILSEYADDLKKLEQKLENCPPKKTTGGKTTEKKKGRKKKDDTPHETAVGVPSGFSIGIGIGGGRREERGNDHRSRKDERGRDGGDGFGTGGGGGTTFGR